MNSIQLKQFEDFADENDPSKDDTIRPLEVKAVEMNKVFDFITETGEKITITIRDQHRRLKIEYSSSDTADDYSISNIIAGRSKFNRPQATPDFIEFIKRVIQACEDQQTVIVYDRDRKMHMRMFNGLQGPYATRRLEGSDIIELALPRICISGTVEQFKVLKDFFSLIEKEQLTRFIESASLKQK